MDGRSPVVSWLAIPRAPHLQNRQLLSLSIAVSLGSFGLYVLYKQDRVAEYVSQIRNAVQFGTNTYDVVKSLTRISATVWDDLRTFIQSDATVVPQSLKQLTKLLTTDEFRHAARTMVMSCFEGMALGGSDRTTRAAPGGCFEDLVERVIVRVTERQDVWSLAIRIATRHAAEELLQIWSVMKSAGLNGGGPGRHRSMNAAAFETWMSPLAADNGRRVVSTVVTAFTSTLVTMFVEKARGVETWDEVIRYLSRPNNFRLIQQLVGVSSREFGQSVMSAVMQSPMPGTRSGPQISLSVPPSSEITADVDYAAPDAAQRLSHQRSMLAIGRPTVADATASLRESFVTIASSQEKRHVAYKFCACVIAELAKMLFKDFVDWFRESVFADCLVFISVLVFECLLFCSIPLLHSYSTGLSLDFE